MFYVIFFGVHVPILTFFRTQDFADQLKAYYVCFFRLFEAVKHSTQPCRGTLNPRLPIRLSQLNY